MADSWYRCLKVSNVPKTDFQDGAREASLYTIVNNKSVDFKNSYSLISSAY